MAYSETKLDSKLVHSPMDEVCGNPNDMNPGNGIYNGEPGLEKRTAGGIPEKTYDEAGAFKNVSVDKG